MRALAKIISSVVRLRTRHHRHATGEIAAAFPNGTFDVSLADGSSLQGIAPRPGVPALLVQADVGAKCLVAWEGSDAFIAAWESSGARQIQLGGSRPLARVGDEVDVMLPEVVQVSGLANGVPFTAILTPDPLVSETLKPQALIRGGNLRFTA
ncbi:MAG: hypothetical protein R3337_00035 [Gammaproteobacteria bacterium]|nr:hypothetical protein [Gammaproteobacteria bacterium]